MTKVQLLNDATHDSKPAACKQRNRYESNQPTNHPFYDHYTGQPASAGTSSYELEDFVGAKFFCPHALADSNQHNRIREKMLEFSSTALYQHCLHTMKAR